MSQEETADKMYGALSYSLGWLSGILIVNAERPRVRFHARQSVVVFGSLSLAIVLADAIFPVGSLLHVPLMVLLLGASFILWPLLTWRAWRGDLYVVPVIEPLTAAFMKPLNIPTDIPPLGAPNPVKLP